MSSISAEGEKQAVICSPSHLVDSTDRLLGGLASAKIQPHHFDRTAVVYIRQSSLRQVIDHRESRARQYCLADYAVRLGWPRERVLVIDEDQGSSAAVADNRSGFQQLLAEVSMDHVGMILGLEMSRLARTGKEWHHLIEVCAIFGTILADQDGIYDPADPNDRMVLGLKGTMSTLELHTMRNRLDKGRLFKAQRGELFADVPSGYVKLPSGGIALDPDEQVRAVVQLIFEKFAELGTARAVFRYLLRHGIRMGIRPHYGPNRDQLEWRRPSASVLCAMLHHPYYAGAYAYGRRQMDPKRKHSGSSKGRKVPMEQWKVLKKDCLPAYITWEQYLRNQEQLRQNGSGWDKPGTPRKGEALLGGLLVCGRCGCRMTIFYTCVHRGRYECRREVTMGLKRTCRGLRSRVLDALISQQVLTALQPASIELSIQTSEDVQKERERHTRLWKQKLERGRYQSRQAERCYRAVDPENRLVARTLEQQWEQALCEQRQLEEEYDRFSQETPSVLTSAERSRIEVLSADIPALWHASTTTAQDRKAIVRCLIDHIVVNVQGDTEIVDVTIHWVGGFISQHQIIRPVRLYGQLQEFDQLVKRLRELQLAGLTSAQIAKQLNQEGFQPPRRQSPYSGPVVRQLLSRLGMPCEHPATVVLGPNEWWPSALARKLEMPMQTLQNWIRRGWVQLRRSSLRGYRILWADGKELKRLKRLRVVSKAHSRGPFPKELTTPQVAKQK